MTSRVICAGGLLMRGLFANSADVMLEQPYTASLTAHDGEKRHMMTADASGYAQSCSCYSRI